MLPRLDPILLSIGLRRWAQGFRFQDQADFSWSLNATLRTQRLLSSRFPKNSTRGLLALQQVGCGVLEVVSPPGAQRFRVFWVGGLGFGVWGLGFGLAYSKLQKVGTWFQDD